MIRWILRALTALILLAALACLGGVARNLYRYWSLTPLQVKVLSSSLEIGLFAEAEPDGSQQAGRITQRAGGMPSYLLRLLLQPLGAEPVQLQEDLAKVTIPEEAFDILAEWAPGSTQTVYGRGAEIRTGIAQDTDELDAALGFGVGFCFLLFFAVSLLFAGGSMERSGNGDAMSGFRNVWVIFALFGFFPLVGSGIFLCSQAIKIHTFVPVEGSISNSPRSYLQGDIPRGVKINDPALQKFAEMTYKMVQFPWNGRAVRGGVDTGKQGAYSELPDTSGTGEPCRFYVNPADRWDTAVNLGWNRDFFIPFGVLAFFGVTFMGAALAIRKIG